MLMQYWYFLCSKLSIVPSSCLSCSSESAWAGHTLFRISRVNHFFFILQSKPFVTHITVLWHHGVWAKCQLWLFLVFCCDDILPGFPGRFSMNPLGQRASDGILKWCKCWLFLPLSLSCSSLFRSCPLLWAARATSQRRRSALLHITDSLLLYVTVALNPLTYRTVLWEETCW